MATAPSSAPTPDRPPPTPEAVALYLKRGRTRRRWAARLAVAALGVAVLGIWWAWYATHRHALAVAALGLEGVRVIPQPVGGPTAGGGRSSGASSVYAMPEYQGGASNLTGQALRPIADLRRVESLSLTRCLRLTDDDLAILRRLPHLKLLALTMARPESADAPSRLTDAMLAHLAGLDELEELILVDVNLTDAGVSQFPSLPALRHLDLGGTRITDASLPVLLDRLPALESLAVDRTGVTPGGLAAAGARRPEVAIHHESTSDLFDMAR